MKNCLLFILFGLGAMFVQPMHAQTSMETILKLRNDKEVSVSVLSKSEQQRIKAQFPNELQNKKISDRFFQEIYDFVNQEDAQCELNLSKRLKKAFQKESNIEDVFKMLRVTSQIDDIFYLILIGSNKDSDELELLNLKKKLRRFNLKHEKLLKNNDLAELFSGFSEWPDEVERCSYKEFVYIKNIIKNKKNKPSESKKDLKILLEEAYRANVIDLETFNKLEYIRTKSFINKQRFWLSQYFKIIFNAKNKMRPFKATYSVKNLEDEDGFTSERVRRFHRLTRRQLLYRKYDETQIVLLAQVLQKASKRMGVDPDTISSRPVITQEFSTINDSGERETYVERIELDPQSQYNLARRLLRKDMTELQMMETFIGLKITFEDIVVAAFETGYITFEDLEYVVKYDNLWNPEVSSFEKIIGFTFNVAGIGSIFLPPPWNVTATIALGIAEGLILNTRKNGAENDNPATFIE